MLKSVLSLSVLISASLPLYAQTEPQRPPYAPPSTVLPEGGLLQMMVGLLLVLAVIMGIAWFLKRFALNHGAPNGNIKVIAGAAVGQRERVVLVEVNGTWLVLGVAPGQVRTLHTMPKGDMEQNEEATKPSNPRKGFQEWLQQMMDKRNAG